MKLKNIFTIILILPILFNSNVISAKKASKEVVCLVTKISDGDTIRCKTKYNELRVRFLGIDAPESKQEFGFESKTALSKLIYNKTVKLIVDSKDRYGRVVGTIFLNDLNVNKYMVANGYAWVYTKYNKDSSFVILQEEARKNKIGLWSKRNPIYPEIFRKKQ